jgi:hypothetical protein
MVKIKESPTSNIEQVYMLKYLKGHAKHPRHQKKIEAIEAETKR